MLYSITRMYRRRIDVSVFCEMRLITWLRGVTCDLLADEQYKKSTKYLMLNFKDALG